MARHSRGGNGRRVGRVVDYTDYLPWPAEARARNRLSGMLNRCKWLKHLEFSLHTPMNSNNAQIYLKIGVRNVFGLIGTGTMQDHDICIISI